MKLHSPISILRISVCTILTSVMLMNSSTGLYAFKPQVISKVGTSRKVVALTFDDGTDRGNISKILKVLSDNGIKATFFVTGMSANANRDSVAAIHENGHVLGNHSYSHKNYTKLTAAMITADLKKADSLIRSITGKSTKPYFRPPYGEYSDFVLRTAGDEGYTRSIMWSVDTRDWEGISAGTIVKRVMASVTPGAIILMHASPSAKHTPAALGTVIMKLKAEGYAFVTVPELLASIVGSTHTVRPGETLWRISRLYGVDLNRLADANSISDPAVILVGQVLKIPD